MTDKIKIPPPCDPREVVIGALPGGAVSMTCVSCGWKTPRRAALPLVTADELGFAHMGERLMMPRPMGSAELPSFPGLAGAWQLIADGIITADPWVNEDPYIDRDRMPCGAKCDGFLCSRPSDMIHLWHVASTRDVAVAQWPNLEPKVDGHGQH